MPLLPRAVTVQVEGVVVRVVAGVSMGDTLPPESIPHWAIGVIQTLATISAKVDAIPSIERDVEQLRKDSVPMVEYQTLMVKVNQLWDLSNSAMPVWNEAQPKITKMWEERSELRGQSRAQARWLRALGVAVTLLSVWEGLHTAGIKITP